MLKWMLPIGFLDTPTCICPKGKLISQSAQKYREMQRQECDIVCEHVDNFRQLITWLTVRVTLDRICNTCNVFLSLFEVRPFNSGTSSRRAGTNIIYNFLLFFMSKSTNSPEGRMSKDLIINYFFSNLILGLLEISESIWILQIL